MTDFMRTRAECIAKAFELEQMASGCPTAMKADCLQMAATWRGLAAHADAPLAVPTQGPLIYPQG